MEIEKVRALLTKVVLAHPRTKDSEEIEALRAIAQAMLHMAEAIEDLQRRLPRPADYL